MKLTLRSTWILLLVLSVGFGVATSFDQGSFWLFVGFTALSIMWTPMILTKEFDWFSVWNFATLNILLAVTFRHIFIYFDYPDSQTINFWYLLGNREDYFVVGSIYYLICLFCIMIGYLLMRTRKRTKFTVSQWNRQRLYLIAAILSLISIISTYAYVNLSGGFLSGISAKRNLVSIETLSSGGSYGMLRYFSSLAIIAYLLLLADIIKYGNKLKKARMVIAFALFLLACFLPFYSNSRTPIAIYFIVTCAVVYYSNRRFPLLKFVFITLTLVILLSIMSAYRSLNSGAADTFIAGALNVPKTFVLDRNNMGVPKTVHIIESTPTTLDHKYGSTFFIWLVAWVPREIWQSKPMVDSGAKELGREIYGNKISGVPPGVVGELYWNFGALGLVFGGLLVGMAIKYVYQRFRPSRDNYKQMDPFIAAAYAIGPMQFGFAVFGHSLGYGVLHTAMNSMAIFGALAFIKRGKVIQRA